MSKFKLNPGAFADSGAAKGQLALLYQLQSPEEVLGELRKLSESRDSETVGEAR